MDNVGESLTRKLGPLPVWVWAIVAGLGLYLLRNRGQNQQQGSAPSVAATQAEAQLVQAEAAARASTMQSPVTIAPGEQLYDPNSGFLTAQNPDWTSILGAVGSGDTLTTPIGRDTVIMPTPKTKPKRKPSVHGNSKVRAHRGASKGHAQHPPKHTKPGHHKKLRGKR